MIRGVPNVTARLFGFGPNRRPARFARTATPTPAFFGGLLRFATSPLDWWHVGSNPTGGSMMRGVPNVLARLFGFAGLWLYAIVTTTPMQGLSPCRR